MEDHDTPIGNPPPQTEKQKKLVAQAKDRFSYCQTWESSARTHFIDDLKFANADAYNGWQWPNAIQKNRDIDNRPCLTVNKTRQHNLQIINDAKKNKPGIQYHPVSGDATYEAAQMMEAIVRHIEYQSNATAHYDTATTFQVNAGWGYLRVATDYAGDDTIDQELFIRGVADPLSVYLDPDAKEPDCSDARYGFVFNDVKKEVFDKQYPKFAGHARHAALNGLDGDWVDKDHVRVCEYFYVTEKPGDTLLSYVDKATGQVKTIRKSQTHGKLFSLAMDDPETRSREIVETEVRYCVLVGNLVAEEKVWPGRYIPIVPVIGEKTVIDGRMDMKGHTRALIDPQRMYNYWSSAAVEYGALQSKSPYIAPEAAIEGHEEYWNTANKANYSVLTYNHMTDDGEQIPAPQRAHPPEQAQLYLSGLQVTQTEMMLVSGQYQSQMGAPGNERSGKAIQERQRQGDNATYHFIDNLGVAIRHLGKIILDLIPKIYDSNRIISILAENGTSMQVEIDPDAKQAYMRQLGHDGEVARRILNPSVGKYEVRADIGPGYATKREEAFNAFTQIITQAPNLTALIGDLLLKSGDFPLGDEAAARLHRMVPPQALGRGPSQEELKLQQQLAQTQGLLKTTMDELAKAQGKVQSKDQMRDIDAYEAETKRMAALTSLLPMDDQGGEGIKMVIRQLIAEAMGTPLTPIIQANASSVQPSQTGLGPLMTAANHPTSLGAMAKAQPKDQAQ